MTHASTRAGEYGRWRRWWRLRKDVVASDVVITMGCGDAFPIFAGKRYEYWALSDPSGKGADDVRAIRDEIDQRVQKLLAELVA